MFWELIGDVTEEVIAPLYGRVLLPHFNDDVALYPTYNITLSILPDSTPENTRTFSIQLINTSLPAEILPSANRVDLTILANDAPHGVFSLDPTSFTLSSDLVSFTREVSFTVIREKGLYIDVLVSYSLYYADPLQAGDISTLISSGVLIMAAGLNRVNGSQTVVGTSMFIGTDGVLSLRLTNVLLSGPSTNNFPPIISNVNSEVNITVDEQHANPR